MIELAATHFVARNAEVGHRRQPHARARPQARRPASAREAITLNELPERLHEFDIVVTCTASTLPIIGKGLLERVVKQRRHAPVFIVDLGVPRDVEPEAADLDDVFLYSVDDLAGDREGQPADPARSGGAGRADDRRPDRAFPALARRPHGGADDRRAVTVITTTLRAAELERARKMLAAGAIARGGARRARARPHQQAPARAAVGAQRRGRRRARGAHRGASRVYRLDEPDDGEP